VTFDEYFTKYYDTLIRVASARTRHPHDVVHDLYLKGREYEIHNYYAWWKRSIWTECSSPKYRIESLEATVEQKQEDPNHEDYVYQCIKHLDEFDRTIFLLYLQGSCMTCVAKESGISFGTIKKSISNTRCLLKKMYAKKG
jgi:DNA-directed RNA polymerase specialized sigma24 family protein